jgi:tetratricopeptide (TPR) repeat protein
MKGEKDAAIADFTRLIELDPTDARAYGERGQLRELKGDLAGAIADYTGSIEFDPTNPRGYSRRSDARRVNGDLGGAMADDKTATDLNLAWKRKQRLCRAVTSLTNRV